LIDYQNLYDHNVLLEEYIKLMMFKM